MRTIVFLVSILLFALGPARAQTLESFHGGFLAGVEARGEPILLADCKEAGTKWVVYFAPLAREARFAEFQSSERQTNGAVLTFPGGKVSANDLMGGLDLQMRERRRIKSILRSNFRFVPAGRFLLELRRMNIRDCAPWDASAR